ncbi:MAG: MazG family protein [Ardenticatenales bacterium]|nr:MazG family protein [Ardenticatenales bacterium]
MSHITIVGLGPGEWKQLTLEAVAALNSHDEIWLSTRHHPLIAAMPAHLSVQSFDSLHEAFEDSLVLVQRIATEVLRLGKREQGVLYGVPGHPWVGERSVRAIVARAREEHLPIRFIEGISLIGPVLSAVEHDALAGLQVAEAILLAGRYYPPVDADRPLLVAQLHSRMVAAEVKSVLLELYSDDHPVTLLHASGTTQARTLILPLYDLDQHSDFSEMTALWVPPLPYATSLPHFQNIVAHLRAPEGCPWDREQDHISLRPFDLEEAYEVAEAIDRGVPGDLRDELGDQLLMILMHAQIAHEAGDFNMGDVITRISEKMVRRHPHVFASTEVADADEVLRNWEAIKAEEKTEKGEPPEQGPFDDIPLAMPALLRAGKVARKVVKQGGEIPQPTASFAAWLDAPSQETLGDLLLALATHAARQKQDPEDLLRRATTRLIAQQTKSAPD